MATTMKHDAQSVHQDHDSSSDRSAPLRDDSQRNPSVGAAPDVTVRHYRLTDGGKVGQLPERVELNSPESYTLRPNALKMMARRFLAGDHGSRPVLIAERSDRSGIVGALHCEQKTPDKRWQLQYLLQDDRQEGIDPVSLALFEFAIAEAGAQGARRLMARIEPDDPVRLVLQRAGFTEYAKETVYIRREAGPGAADRRVRAQEQSDVWGVHQLYMQTTPREVQHAEALTSDAWGIDTEGRTKRGWFINDSACPRGYIRVRTSRARHLLELMFLPDSLAVLPTLVSAVSEALAQTHDRPVYASVRSYQQEASSILVESGFEPIADQVLMVRYTTAPASQAVRSAEAFDWTRAIETDRQRVPSYYVRDARE